LHTYPLYEVNVSGVAEDGMPIIDPARPPPAPPIQGDERSIL
jgi:hypothetical protein